MKRFENFEYTEKNRIRVRAFVLAIKAEHVSEAFFLSLFLFFLLLLFSILGYVLGWPTWVSAFFKKNWIIINIVLLIFSILLFKYSTTLEKISDTYIESDPELYHYVNDYQKLVEIIAFEAFETDRYNIPGRIFTTFAIGTIFGMTVFGGIFP